MLSSAHQITTTCVLPSALIPTWYDMTENYNATLNSDITYWGETYSQTLSDELNPDYLIYDYRLTTPWKFNVSMGTTLQNLVAIGAEYEYQNYSSTQLEDMDGYELGGQADVKEFLKGVHTLRRCIYIQRLYSRRKEARL